MSSQRVVQIADIHDRHHGAAVALLARFFKEESFSTPRDKIAQNLGRMLTDGEVLKTNRGSYAHP